MAVLTAATMGEVQADKHNIQSFFKRPAKSHDASPGALNPIGASKAPITQDLHHVINSSTPLRKDAAKDVTSNGPLDASSATMAPKVTHEPESNELREVDPNLDRRKRRRTSSPRIEQTGDGTEPPEGFIARSDVKYNNKQELDALLQADLQDAAATSEEAYREKVEYLETSPLPRQDARRSAQTVGSMTPGVPAFTASGLSINEAPTSEALLSDNRHFEEVGSSTTKPKKVLRYNPKTGTIGSPPAKKSKEVSDESSKKISPGRRGKKKKSLVIKIKYGLDDGTRIRMGSRIDHVFKNAKTFTSAVPSAAKSLPDPVKPAQTSEIMKQTHPFFLGKVAARYSSLEYSTPPMKKLAEMIDPHKPPTIAITGIARPQFLKSDATLDSTRPASQIFGGCNKILRFPGAVEPIWPPSGMTHIRGNDTSPDSATWDPSTWRQKLTPERKSKYTTIEVHEDEDVLKALALRLNIDRLRDSIKNANSGVFVPPDKCLRLPRKHFETGTRLQSRIRGEVSSYLPLRKMADFHETSEDELHCSGQRQDRAHPAIEKVYKEIATTLTAFDQSRYETQSWVYKYAPCTAAGVLQTGREPSILKGWLQALTVVAVDTGASEEARNRGSSAAPKRSTAVKNDQVRRKRKSKLEGFVVSSDEELNDMDEISEPEDSLPRASQGVQKKTVVRVGDGLANIGKLTNTVVISGPNGCGKTAMVYAVAKELEFEVFEINASCRRSGKDILERVGDMTKNHLVHPSQTRGSSTPDEDLQRLSDALAADLQSGRQGTMNSFFKSKTTKSTAKPVKKGSAPSSQAQKSQAKQQKQSLILFEEVDILYEEDKQFWATVMGLIVQSKRPIIMTCNDESVLPLQSLSLHAIIRLAPPPVELAVDYLLLIAANEGHVLKRNPVKALYLASKNDLRASITELNLWCQIGVGDCKGGLEWYYPRWPAGSDTDEYGNTIRVVSEGTYKKGMGWVGRDLLHDVPDQSEAEEEILREAWRGWQIDGGDRHDSCSGSFERSTSSDEHATLSSYETFTDAMSLADACGSGSLATGNRLLLDPTVPEILPRSRDDFVIGYELLQADALVHHESTSMNISFWIKAQARRLLKECNRARPSRPVDARVVDLIIQAAQEGGSSISRHDFSVAFDPIAEPDRNAIHSTSSFECSAFDRTTSMIAVDIAPFVRSIVSYDAQLQQERAKLSNLLSEGGRSGKRMRTTRAAFSALEGGARNTTRREKYFGSVMNPHLVLKTGMQCWLDAVVAEEYGRGLESPSKASNGGN